MAITIPLDEALNKMFGRYPTQANGPSSYILINKAEPKAVQLHLGEACHMSMVYAHPNLWDVCLTACPNTDEISLAYIRMLINGPFRAFSDSISIETVDKNHYIKIDNLDTIPGNVVYNFCIATRIPIEHRFFLDPFADFLGRGVNPTLAFLLSYQVSIQAGVKGQEGPTALRANYNSNHMWYDSTSLWSNLLKGEMDQKVFSPPYKKSPTDGRPCNNIWPKYNRFSGKVEFKPENLTVEEICEYFELPIALPKASPKKRRKKFNPGPPDAWEPPGWAHEEPPPPIAIVNQLVEVAANLFPE